MVVRVQKLALATSTWQWEGLRVGTCSLLLTLWWEQTATTATAGFRVHTAQSLACQDKTTQNAIAFAAIVQHSDSLSPFTMGDYT